MNLYVQVWTGLSRHPTMKTMTDTADLIVVGAGILGLATAWRAHRHGLSVHVIDRADRPVGASIQNFGHACFTAQADDLQDLGAVSADGWAAAAADAGFQASRPGTVLPAVTPTEMQVLEEFHAHRGEDVQLIERGTVRDLIGNPDLDCVGGAHLPRDMRVNPREAAPALARHLATRGLRFSWRTSVHTVGDGEAHTSRGVFRAPQIVVCPGEHLNDTHPDLVTDHDIRTCTLTMALIDRPSGTPDDLAMLTGTSMTRYDGIAAMPSVDDLRRELVDREPSLTEAIANVMATAVPDGILVGDSHDYDASPDPFIDAAQSDLLLDRTARYLGISRPVVRQRWKGRYADSPSTNLVLHHPDDRTTVAVVTSGIGMTLSFGIADLILTGADAPGR